MKILSDEKFIKLAIVGSRSYDNYREFVYELNNIINPKQIGVIISGGAEGADKLAEKYAKENAIPLLVFYPNWNEHGRRAGPRRNKLIVSEASHVIAFWNGFSLGTKCSIDLAKKYKKYLKIIKSTDRVETEHYDTSW